MATAATSAQRVSDFDRLAGEILASLSSMSFGRAESPSDVDATFRMRCECVIENGWGAPEDFPDGRERDEYDGDAIHVVCRDGDAIVASLRIVRPDASRPLPTERDFDLTVTPAGTAVDVGRIVVSPSARAGRSHLLVAGLFARSWLEARALGYDRVIGVATSQAIALYRGLGVELDVLGEQRMYWGELRSPIEFAGPDETKALALLQHRKDEDETDEELDGLEDGFTRRRLLAHAGALGAGTLLVVGLPESAAAAGSRRIGSGPTDRRSVGFLARIDQVGVSLVSYGYLTRVEGLSESALFTHPPATSSSQPAAGDVSGVRFTVVSSATIENISTLGNLINTTAAGRTDIYYLPGGGASLDNPQSFAAGAPIASFTGVFQTNLTVDSPNNAAVAISADLTQRRARSFTLGGNTYQFGRAGLAWNQLATGRGERTEPTAPESHIFVSGDMGVIDAARKR